MDIRDFQKKNLDDKIKKFKSSVHRASVNLGVKQPRVKIHECPHSRGNEIAHCHTETGEICISEYSLNLLSIDEIINTANHEVAHLKHGHHEPSFHNTHQNLNASTWEPPSGGVVSFSEADLNRPMPKRKPNKIDEKSCNNYKTKIHTKGKLIQCKYCDGYFCKDHSSPGLAGLRNFKDYNKFEEEKEEMMRGKNTHPCIPYNVYLDKKLEKKNEKYEKALNKLLSKKNYKTEKIAEPSNVQDYISEEYPEDVFDNFTKQKMKRSRKIGKKPNRILLVFIILLIILIGAWQFGYVGNLIQHFNKDYSSDYALGKINGVRISNNLSILKENESAYNMAFFLAKEKYNRGGEEAKRTLRNTAIGYGVNTDFGIKTAIIDYSLGYNLDYILFKWGDIRPEEDILNPNYNYGSVSCFENFCVFITF